MNTAILHKDVQGFIVQNLKADVHQLALKGSPFPKVDLKDLMHQIVGKQKAQKKLPTWFETEGIYFPPKVNIEQTSSEVTANYKSELVSGQKLIDLTGGFGVDCHAFSKTFQQVIHCEKNESLSKIADHNFKQLDVKNIKTITGDGFAYLQNTTDNFDCVYIDPSRRNDVKGKVFLLKDCEPNVPEHLDFLFQKSSTILIKLSPILDISSVLNELKFVRSISVIAVNNEVKELLLKLELNYNKNPIIQTVNFSKNKKQTFNYELNSSKASLYDNPKSLLYEPNAAILKSGGFHAVSKQFNLIKLHQHSHLYTSDVLIDFPGRSFQIKNVIPYDKKKIKREITETKANITTRNFPKSVQQIRKELKIKDGGDLYLFFTTNYLNKLICIFCKKI